MYLVDKHLHTTEHFTSGHRLSISMFTLDAQSIRIGILRRGMHIESALIVFILYFRIHLKLAGNRIAFDTYIAWWCNRFDEMAYVEAIALYLWLNSVQLYWK